MAYRRHVDEALEALLAQRSDAHAEIARLVEIGINHEQQHQELLLTDILALFAANPLRPAYHARKPIEARRRRRHDRLGRIRGRHPLCRPRRLRLLLGQRRPAPHRPRSSLPSRRPSRHQRGMARVHARRRLSHRFAVARRRLDAHQPRGVAGAALLGGDRRRLAADDALGPAGGRARRTRVPRLLLRGRRVRSLGRQAAPHRVRVGGRGQQASR